MSAKEMRILYVMKDDGDMTEPMNLMLLSALGKQDRPWRSSHLALLESKRDILDIVTEVRPQIVATSAITGSHRYYLEALKAIKEHFGSSVFTILGGPYCSSYPGVIADRPYLDAIGYLECDDAWTEFLDAFENGKDIDNIPNIITRGNHHRALKSFQVTDPTGRLQNETYVDQSFYRNRKSNLDDLPYMDRALIYENTAFCTRYKRTHMVARGCPHRCTYCFEHDYNEMYKGKGKIRQLYSPIRFCEELAKLKKDYRTDFIKLYDDVIAGSYPGEREWLEEFAEVYPKIVGIPYHCLTRCDLVCANPWVLALHKKAGLYSLSMSIESGNNFIRDHIIARDMAQEEIEEAFELARKLRIETFSNTILGIPGPKIPAIHDPEFDKKVEEIVKDSKLYKPARRKRPDIAKELAAAKSELTTVEYRKFATNYLKKAGLHATQLEYERQSVSFTIKVGASFGEFGTLAPYPRTEVTTRYLIPKGFFDGDYDKLAASYQTSSPLNCFTEREKKVQQNLTLLGTICIFFSGNHSQLARWLARPISYVAIQWLSGVPYRWATRIYQYLYTLTKTHMHDTRVYPMRRTLREKINFFLETLRLDLWKHFKKKKAVIRGDWPRKF